MSHIFPWIGIIRRVHARAGWAKTKRALHLTIDAGGCAVCFALLRLYICQSMFPRHGGPSACAKQTTHHRKHSTPDHWASWSKRTHKLTDCPTNRAASHCLLRSSRCHGTLHASHIFFTKICRNIMYVWKNFFMVKSLAKIFSCLILRSKWSKIKTS